MHITINQYYCDPCWKLRIKTPASWGYAAKHHIGHVCDQHRGTMRDIALEIWPVKKTVIKH